MEARLAPAAGLVSLEEADMEGLSGGGWPLTFLEGTGVVGATIWLISNWKDFEEGIASVRSSAH